MTTTAQEQVISDIRQERARQDAKWGADREQSHTVWHTILSQRPAPDSLARV